jgi:site-specific DNA-methyltransferase (adenine-specific)
MRDKKEKTENKNKVILGDNMNVMPTLEADSIDCIVTDPPYGLSFMGKDWDKAVPSIGIWQQCLRVLKPGAFAFVMCIPRQDCLARMMCRLEDAGFNVAFSSIYWTYATGFPKAQNLSKAVDKRAGVKREVIDLESTVPERQRTDQWKQSNQIQKGGPFDHKLGNLREITLSSTPQAKALDGAYGGFQPKPAVEIIIVAMKPLSERTYIDQAISNGHGCTWLDECRIPYITEKDATFEDRPNCSNKQYSTTCFQGGISKRVHNNKGRFPANVLCEDDVLDDGIERKTCDVNPHLQTPSLFCNCNEHTGSHKGDTCSFSRYFSLDAWFTERIKSLLKEAQKTFPWLIVPKASKMEKNKGLEALEVKIAPFGSANESGKMYANKDTEAVMRKNNHPTIKPIKLMSWLITLGTREGDIVLDPFLGSGTTMIAAKMLGRYCIGIEKEKEYFDLATLRCNEFQKNINEYF